ncbi:nitrogenase iron-molybdenum cofactor biosynthesis protein NifN [Oceanobacter mangrovi]|uniref:nitrogenase iron-molybdenum cofactor biosynthesis protein NifN n=1 Tax=Oceanobacter mangrovi TaxID=2862510 RepID=UPI001C8E2BB1|nr:nitrogenase iron-molybdenum cofactor biosynthesis protein NifN [Oceanobacter mangrovi]
MSQQVKRRAKALSVSPLKTSQTIGATLAFLGVKHAVPLMHGSQGCTAFAKVFFVRHFREPVPLQTTAMDQISSVMGADDNIVEALKIMCEKTSPKLIGVATTGLAETQGADIKQALHRFRSQFPQYDTTKVVMVNTPDFAGSFESGFALAVKGLLDTMVPTEQARPGSRKRQVTVLCGANLTPGDLEYLHDSISAFGLRPLLVPDLSGSLDGHLDDGSFSPVTTGGVSLDELAAAGDSCAVLAVGESLHETASHFAERVGLPVHCFGHLIGLDSVDEWLMTLSQLSGESVPERYQRHRRQLQDAMLDSHFMIGFTRVAVAGDGDLIAGFSRLLLGMGADVVTAVAPANNAALKSLAHINPIIGDFEEVEKSALEGKAQILISNSHGVESAHRLGVPILRAGFPQYDILGGFQRCWFGYQGTSQALFDLANLKLSEHEDVQPYHSIYSQKQDQPAHGAVAGAASH